MKLMKNLIIAGMLSAVSLSGTATYAIQAKEIGQHIDDSVIDAKVNAKLLLDKTLSPSNIDVSSKDGIVTLKGTVDSEQQYASAIMIAESVEGVKDVNIDFFKVKESTQPFTDMAITSKIKGRLIKNKVLDIKNVKFWSLDVETNNGVVYLSGTVDTLDQKNNVIQIATSVDGVKSVNSDGLSLKGKQSSWQEQLSKSTKELSDQWSTLKTSIQKKWNKISDEQLKQIDGKFDRLVETLQKNYQYTKQQAEKQVNAFLESVTMEKSPSNTI